MNSREFFPDGQDTLQLENQTVRKGTIGAFIQNSLALRNTELDAKSRKLIINDIINSVAQMKATKAFEVFEIRDPEVRQLVEQHLEMQSSR
jgi:hypothetical protein